MSLSKPNQIAVPFANAGLKAAIPANADNVLGRAGYDQGFPPINMTAKVAGGIPPFGQDMNGILFDVDKAIQYMQAGMSYPYDAAFATAIGGYNIGARVLRTDGRGEWLNTTNNNTTNPEAGGVGWVPAFSYGITNVSMTNANVSLTAAQSGLPIIIITGTLTANLNLFFPRYTKTWTVLNLTTGAFTITAKTASGSGVVLPQGVGSEIVCDGTDIYTAYPEILGISSTAQAQGLTDNSTALSPLRLAEAFKGANQSFATNGYQKLPGGLILQWGAVASLATATSILITLPVTFPNAILYANAQHLRNGTTGDINTWWAVPYSTSQIRVYNGTSMTTPGQWFSIGY